MKKIAVFLAAALVAASAFAGAYEVGNSYIVVNSAWYNGSGTGNAAFNDLGELSSLTLGGELLVKTEDWAWDWGEDWGGPYMGYRIEDMNGGDLTGDQSINLTKVGGGDYEIKIQNYPGVNVSSFSTLADDQQYKLVVWFGGVDSCWDAGNNFSASFTKVAASDVPEPATMSLLGLGALALALRRKLRK